MRRNSLALLAGSHLPLIDVPHLPIRDLPDAPASSPLAFLLWIARLQWATLCAGVAFGILWMLAQALLPYALGRAVDEAVGTDDIAALVQWSGVLLGLAVVNAGTGVMRHRFAVWNWVQAALTASQVVGHHVTRVGAALPTKLPTGEVVSTVASDAIRLGDTYDITARLAGAIVSYGVVAALLLNTSPTLGLLVLLGVPVTGALLALVVRPLQRAQQQQRDMAGRLATLGSDTVAGLRVLRGVGGEPVFLRRYTERSQQVRAAGVRVAGVQATLDALQVLLPGAFVVLVTWLGARLAVSGEITPGELVAFYGYASFLVLPLRTATEALQKMVRGHVAAQKVLAVTTVRPGVTEPNQPAPAPGPRPDLFDPTTGLSVRAGGLTAVVSGAPADGAELADRLGRMLDDPAQPPARLGGVPVTELPVAEVRRRVVVSDTDPRLFTGWLRSQLDPTGGRDEAVVRAALDVAAAGDVLDSLPNGLDDEVTERGRSFSGGQRQRLALARALLTEAETLVLVEPTSAVDAHTEARIADRLRLARDGRTTVVVSASPLLLDRADTVAFLDGGHLVAEGTHLDLLRRDDEVGTAYRNTVTRGEDT
jgi:ABC-type multidrug transport system fused ATPase/permease subunit